MATDPLTVADRLMTAIEAGDVAGIDALYAPDMTIWTTLDADRRDRASAVAVLAWVIEQTASIRYDILRREAIDGGFVQQHVLHGTLPDGTAFSNPACLVVDVDAEGRITRIDEYLDRGGLAALAEVGLRI